jgi:hypothetical protein
MIAPPPSLQDREASSGGVAPPTGPGGGLAVAAKIMAKYGYKVSEVPYLSNIHESVPVD